MTSSQPTSQGAGTADARTAPVVAVTAFGKHPGWNDHIDDIELGTPEMVELKRWLYVDGLRPNIDNGVWEKLEPGHRLDAIDHAFVWRRGEHVLIGRMWSSRDGKGRAKYPMILCAQLHSDGAVPAITHVIDVLDDIRRACVDTETAAGVRAALDDARRRLEHVESDHEGSARNASNDGLASIASIPVFRDSPEGLLRVLYQLERDMKAFAPLPRDAKSSTATTAPRSQHLRAPAPPGEPGPALTTWLRFVGSRVTPSADIFALLPLDGDWIDIIVGLPTESQLRCIRATPESVASAHAIPYEMDASTVARLRHIMRDANDGREPSDAGRADASTTAAAPDDAAASRRVASSTTPARTTGVTSGRSTWPLILLVLILLVLLIVSVVLMVQGA